MATHFDGSGTPDGSSTPSTLLWSTSALIAVGIAGLVAIALWRRPLSGIITSVVAFTGAFFAGLGAAGLKP